MTYQVVSTMSTDEPAESLARATAQPADTSMATSSSQKRKSEVTGVECAICLELPLDAMMAVECGHSFCEDCATKAGYKCCLCRKVTSYKPNFALRNMLQRPPYAEEYQRLEKEKNSPARVIADFFQLHLGTIAVRRRIPDSIIAYIIKLLLVPDQKINQELSRFAKRNPHCIIIWNKMQTTYLYAFPQIKGSAYLHIKYDDCSSFLLQVVDHTSYSSDCIYDANGNVIDKIE